MKNPSLSLLYSTLEFLRILAGALIAEDTSAPPFAFVRIQPNQSPRKK
jgi:hypothetical protein